MKNKKTILFICLTCALYYLNFMGRAYGLYNNFMLTGVFNFIVTFYLLTINPFKKTGLFLIFFPFVLLTVTVIHGLFNSIPMPGFIGYVMYLLSTGFGIFLYESNRKIIISVIYGLLFIIALFNYNNMYEFYYSIIQKNEIVGGKFPKIKLTDKYGTVTEIQSNGKIIVLDLWSNYCGNCIKAFPKFEKLTDDFQKDTEIDFYAINIYNNKKDISESEKYLKGYTFKNYYGNRSIFDTLNFNGVPIYMVVGKDGIIKYFGNLNTETFETYNNIYKLIEHEK